MSLTTDQVFGNSSTAEDVFAVDNAVPDTPWQRALSSLRGGVEQLRETAGKVAQPFAAAADMLVGAPANLVGRIKGAGAQINEVFQGGTKAEQEAAGAAGKELWGPVGEAFKTPFQSAVKSLTGAKHYDQEIVEKALEAISHKAAEYSGGMLTSYDVGELLGATMDALGVKGISASVKYARARQIESAAKKEMQQQAAKDGALAEEVFAEPKPDFSSIPEPVEVTPKILKEIFARAKDPGNAVDNLFAAARKNRGPRIEGVEPDLTAADRAIGEGVPPVEKTRLSEARDLNSNPAPLISPTLESAMRKVSADQKWDLTAEERIALQDTAQKAGLVDAEGKAIKSKQGGFMDPRLSLAIIGLGGIGISGILYMQKNHPEIVDEIRERARKMLGLESQSDKIKKNDRDWKEWNDRMPLRNEEGNGLAMGDALGPLAVGMAVKGKGGNWHLAAVERLSGYLSSSLRKSPAVGLNHPDYEVALKEVNKDTDAWSDKAVTRYLQRYAGTVEDPLKDVEVPYAGTTTRWEVLTDTALSREKVQGPKGEETQWTLDSEPSRFTFGDPTPTGAVKVLQSYLSHVGDYLRQNVAPEKLAQYDLVRAVKETAANDARVAKEMERAAAASTKDLPVYRDYGDGMKWVELRLPEKLTEEQARGVRKAKRREESDVMNERFDGAPPGGWIALGKDGKPIQNAYTEAIASGRTPEEAWLAGKLAEEGNQLGHCVGGYCDAVASGESKIYSLRDAKGKSHVTVEVEPPTGTRYAHLTEDFVEQASPEIKAQLGKPPQRPTNFLNHSEGDTIREKRAWDSEVRAHPAFQEWVNSQSSSILQIKGKQNRAPAEAYRKYVQDFVRNGPDGQPAKWGEVGDLEGTGLRDVVTLDKDLFKALNDKGELNSRYLTEQELAKKVERHNSQRGSADPKLLAGIAAAGGLAAYFAQNPDDADALKYGAMLGMGGLGKGLKSGASSFAKGLDYAFGALSTRLGNISESLRLRARDYERKVMERTEQTLTTATPFLQVLKKTPEGSPLDMALLNADGKGVEAALAGKPEALIAWRQVRGVLDQFEKEHKVLGRFKEGISSYFPRIVKDLEGLKGALGQEMRTSLEEALLKAEAKMIKEQQRGLTDVETSIIVNRSLNARPPGSHLPGYAHSRGVDVVTPELRPFYTSPVDSLLRYASAAIQDLEMAKFFGKDLATRKDGSKVLTDVDASVGNIVAKELKAGNISHTQANELRALLKARFEGGERTPSSAVQDARNLTNVALLGQFGSAATQIGDSVMTLYHHSLGPTLKALKQKLTGDSQVSGRDFGIVNHIAEELGSNRWTGRALQAVFKANGFAAIDQFAKGLNLNAGLIKNQGLAQTVAGRAKLTQKWGKAFGDEFPALVEDLRSKTISDRVKSLAFSELSDAQPLTKAEMPQAYLEHPNGRILYQMKTYMLKQMDVIRRDAYNQIRDGHYATGAKNLVAIASALALSNIPGDIIKNWLSGRDADLDKIDYVEMLLKNFGVSRYTLDQIGSGKPVEVARDIALPPYKHYQELYNALKPGAEDKEEAKGMKYVPLVGRAIYDRELGGNEARTRAEAVRARIKARNAREAENPSLKQRRLERKIRRELRGLQ